MRRDAGLEPPRTSLELQEAWVPAFLPRSVFHEDASSSTGHCAGFNPRDFSKKHSSRQTGEALLSLKRIFFSSSLFQKSGLITDVNVLVVVNWHFHGDTQSAKPFPGFLYTRQF